MFIVARLEIRVPMRQGHGSAVIHEMNDHTSSVQTVFLPASLIKPVKGQLVPVKVLGQLPVQDIGQAFPCGLKGSLTALLIVSSFGEFVHGTRGHFQVLHHGLGARGVTGGLVHALVKIGCIDIVRLGRVGIVIGTIVLVLMGRGRLGTVRILGFRGFLQGFLQFRLFALLFFGCLKHQLNNPSIGTFTCARASREACTRAGDPRAVPRAQKTLTERISVPSLSNTRLHECSYFVQEGIVNGLDDARLKHAFHTVHNHGMNRVACRANPNAAEVIWAFTNVNAPFHDHAQLFIYLVAVHRASN